MDEYAEELFKNCKREGDVSEDIITKYQNIVSEDIIAMWKTYGFCSTQDGYYRVTNPDDYSDIIKDIYYSEDEPFVIFVTAMADLITYQGGYFFYVDIRHQKCGGAGKDFSIMMRKMMGTYFKESKLSWNQYEEAVKMYGIPEYDECFAYEPLLSMGGKENVNSIKKVKLQPYLDIVNQMQDIISL